MSRKTIKQLEDEVAELKRKLASFEEKDVLPGELYGRRGFNGYEKMVVEFESQWALVFDDGSGGLFETKEELIAELKSDEIVFLGRCSGFEIEE